MRTKGWSWQEYKVPFTTVSVFVLPPSKLWCLNDNIFSIVEGVIGSTFQWSKLSAISAHVKGSNINRINSHFLRIFNRIISHFYRFFIRSWVQLSWFDFNITKDEF